MSYYLDVLKKYAQFSGRARRKEYWMFILINLVIAIVLSVVVTAIKMPYISYIYSLAIFIPSLAVAVRRLHDLGKSGFWYFIIFIPIAGVIWLIVLLATEGESVENAYGANPKLVSVEL